MWQADRELSGAGAVGGVQRAAATAGTYHETRQLSVALPAGGSGASHGAQRSGVAEEVFSPSGAARTVHRQGRHGAETGGLPPLGVVPESEVRAVSKSPVAPRPTR